MLKYAVYRLSFIKPVCDDSVLWHAKINFSFRKINTKNYKIAHAVPVKFHINYKYENMEPYVVENICDNHYWNHSIDLTHCLPHSAEPSPNN